MKSLTTEPRIPRMKADEFLRFMEDPKSKVRIVEEYQSTFLKEGEEIKSTLEQNKEVEIKGCLSYLQFLYYGPASKKNQAILRASFVDGYDTKHKFLCTKNPAEEDSEVFWQSVWDNHVEIIVMIGKLTEKSYQYWSSTERQSVVSGKFKITTREVIVHSHFTATLLTLTSMKQRRLVFHYQYTDWPKGSLPHPGHFLDFYFFVDNVYLKLKNRMPNNKSTPILIHCFDGLGGSQVFCAIDICITKYDLTKVVSLSHVVERMREQKPGSINSSDLYALCYEIIKGYV
ncbi:protein tyrosine phosphatase [Cotesia plutellae polydnavirus]|nr:protein tyrosine phosphatase [Cotesia plutellae polydnavirus]